MVRRNFFTAIPISECICLIFKIYLSSSYYNFSFKVKFRSKFNNSFSIQNEFKPYLVGQFHTIRLLLIGIASINIRMNDICLTSSPLILISELLYIRYGPPTLFFYHIRRLSPPIGQPFVFFLLTMVSRWRQSYKKFRLVASQYFMRQHSLATQSAYTNDATHFRVLI